MRAAATKKRPYLQKDQRRFSIIQAASTLVEADGWQALTMMAVAKHAQVSRQLIYQHFSSVDELMLEVAVQIFRDGFAATKEALETHEQLSLAAIAAPRAVASLPAGRRHAIWQVLSTPYREDSSLGKLAAHMRKSIVDLSSPAIARALKIDEAQARNLAWMINITFWGAVASAEDGEQSLNEALNRYAWMIRRLVDGLEAGTPP